MAVQAVQKRYGAADKGLITEGNEILSPENTTLDEANYELLPDKTRRRRRPIREEMDFSFDLNNNNRTTNLDSDTAAITAYVWDRPGDEDNTTVMVEQAGSRIQFFQLTHDNPTRIQEGYLANQNIDLLRFSRWANTPGETAAETRERIGRFPCTYTTGNGMLFISHPATGTLMTRYRTDVVASLLGRVFRTSPVGTWIRDFEGAEPVAGIDENVNEPSQDGAMPAPTGSYITPWNAILPDRTLLTGNNFVERYLGGAIANADQYNLSNTGWPDEGIINFFIKTQVGRYDVFGGKAILTTRAFQRGLYPALMQRYADGRIIKENEGAAGIGAISGTVQEFIDRSEATFDSVNPLAIIAGPRRSSEPAKGRRIKHSDYSPVGHFDPIPHEYADTAEIFNETGITKVRIYLRKPCSHTRGKFIDEYKAFVYSMTFAGVVGGTGDLFGQAGFTGTFEIDRLEDSETGTEGKEHDIMVFRVPELYGETPTITSMQVFDGPQYTSHIGWDAGSGVDGPDYDYRRSNHPSAAEFMDGRLFQLEDEHRRVYFSQVLQYNPQGDRDFPMIRAGMCYTEADPTDPDDNALVASDGGYINMSSAGEMVASIVFNRSLLIFTSDGVWEITGNRQFSSFSPDSFAVRKVGEAGIIGRASVVLAQDTVLYLSNEGMMAIAADPRTGNMQVTNLTDKTIRAKLESFSLQQQQDCRVAYDKNDKTIRWIFPERTDDADPFSPFGPVTQMLTLSQLHGAWTVYQTEGYGIAEIVVMPYEMNLPTYNRYRYLVMEDHPNPPFPAFPWFIRWSLEVDFNELGGNDWIEAGNPLNFGDGARFRDFQDFDFINNPRPAPEAFLDTNHHMLGDGSRWLTVTYLTTFNRQVESHWIADGNQQIPNIPGSTLVEFMWDWSDHTKFGKFTAPVETYRRRRTYIPGVETEHESGEPLLVAKSKIRGRGREFRARYYAPDHFDSHIVGWTVEGTVGSAV